MFSSDSSRGSAATSTTGETAKRVLSSFLETSGLVCGSLKDTVEDKLADKDMDMKWVKHELHNINTKLEKPREQILNMTEKACAMGGNKKGRGGTSNNDDYGLVGSPPVVLQHSSMGLGATNSSFLDETIDNDDTHTFTTVDGGRTLSVNTTLDNNDDEETMASTLMTAETPPKHKSRFAAVLNEQKQYETDVAEAAAAQRAAGGSNVVIGLCLSRNNSTLGHPDTVTRQTAFDFNELQDRDYKYVSSTDDSGWMAGGGERGDPYLSGVPREFDPNHSTSGSGGAGVVGSGSEDGIKVKSFGAGHKIAAPDRVHIPIIQINAASSAVIDEIVSALARGEIFIPQVSILPETLSVNQTSPPDLQVHFGCDKNDDTNPEDWTNWCLEFLHNQLYEYFAPMGAQWSKRPFQITLARKVRWATVKHMNKYFARSEQVINSWREKGPQYLQPPYSDDSSRGVILEEITRPHGIYLIQNGKPTNYFAPNFQPPYTTKMRRSLIRNVINKSWDAKHRDWLSQPLPRMRGPVQLISSVMGCANPGHLSPVEERAVSSNVGAFHMRTDFDMVHDSRDMNVRPETPPEQQHHEEVRSSRNKDRRKEDSHRHHHHHHSDKQHTHDSPQRKINPRPTPSIPSDESYGTSTRPSGTMSLSLEETMTDPTTDDPITASRTQSTLESPERNKQWSSDMLSSPEKDPQDAASLEDKHFFNGSGNGGTSSFGSTSKVSISDSSLAESERERERKSDSEQQPRQNRPSENQPPVHSPMRKVDDRRGDKFAKTKSKRREMRDQRRQDENVERIAPSSKNSDIPRRGMNDSDGVSSPSADSMAYSLDSRSQFGFPVAPANDAGSVMTMGTDNQSLLSYVTRSTMVHSRFPEDENQPKDPEPSEPEGDDISLSLLESKSTIVPGDEELNAVGWAKALDPNSGSYYYFTLDRQKTVWENPLGTSP